MRRKSERGNILFIIFTAVMLFAALAWAITRNWGGGSTAASSEEARLMASEIVGYGNGLRPGIDRLLLLGGASDKNDTGKGILFSHASANAAYGTPGTQPKTEVFHSSGGKLTYQTPPAAACLSACSYEFSGQYNVPGVGLGSKSELVMLVVDITKAVCEKANIINSLSWASVPTEAALTLTRFDGVNYGDSGGANAITLSGTFSGLRGFCYRESSGGQRYIYVHVIRAR